MYSETPEASLPTNGVLVCCPQCGWEPDSRLFLKLTTDAYRIGIEQRIKIVCQFSFCGFSGLGLEWLKLY